MKSMNKVLLPISTSLMLLFACQAPLAGGWGDFMGGASQGIGEMGRMLEQQRQQERQLEHQKELIREEYRLKEEYRLQQEERERQRQTAANEARKKAEEAANEAKKKAEAEAEKTLDGLQPDWRQVVASTAFRNWMTTLPKDEQDKLHGSWEPYYIADKITEFNKSNEVVSNDSMEGWVKVSSTISTGKIGVKGKQGRILLSGEIRPGDAEIIASLMEKQGFVALKLNSKGGDVAESMKIVSLIKGAHLATDVAPRGFCASACFFLYLAACLTFPQLKSHKEQSGCHCVVV